MTDDDDAPPVYRHCEEAAKPPTRQSQPKTEDDRPPLPDDDDAPPIPDYCDVPPMPDDWDAPPLPDDDDAPPERGELDPAWRREEELLWEMFG